MSRLFLSAALAAVAILGVTPISAARATPAPDDAADTGKPVRQCFSVSRIANWTTADNKIVYLRVEGGAIFQVTLAGQCLKPARTGNTALSFATNMGGDVCKPIDLTVIVATGIAPLRCPVESLRRLTTDEIAALPADQKP
jgi:hypothetical protein